MADCGPINPLQQVSKHSQQDRSLQQDRLGQHHHQHQQQQLRSLQHSQQLDNEFLQRQQMHPSQQLNPQLQPQGLQFQQPHFQQHQQHNPQAQANNGAWANDFARLSLNSAHAGQQQQQGAWNEQFLASQNSQQRQHISTTHHQSSNMFQYHDHQMPLSRAPQVMFNQTTTSIHAQRSAEHDEVYHAGKLNNDIEEEFKRLEQSFKAPPPPVEATKQVDPLPNHNTNLEFQKSAQDISNAMNSAKGAMTSEKFKNSQFLNMMLNIGSGDITLNEDQTKLVNKDGADIHELKTDGAKESNTNRLPDPLEGLSKEDITTPFQTAQRVAQNHENKPYSWDESYSDYRNDDTEF